LDEAKKGTISILCKTSSHKLKHQNNKANQFIK